MWFTHFFFWFSTGSTNVVERFIMPNSATEHRPTKRIYTKKGRKSL